ncbi:immunoglobulin-binding protein 1 isoform X2 [Rhinatrema bivittatum]|uniref:immunoglobulin-binding protein 1 isoform X2 n=1 Tax=Rhinatrema bivittatum TaxID=194408 RepID=UPI00112818E5|nr:immunoglobulin-binding protein 1 isoform X2 [Rhinatrema bivittatum]
MAEEAPKLSELLERGWRELEEVEASSEPLNSRLLQDKVKHGLALLEQARRGVAELQLFSRNEELEEVASADLKFFLLPALLGALTLKLNTPTKRMDQLQTARSQFMDFLRCCKDYDIGAFQLPQSRENSKVEENTAQSMGAPSQPNLVAMATHRQAKIERYKQKMEMEKKLASITDLVRGGNAEDEQVREFYLLHIQKWVSTSLDEMESLDQEMELLRGREAMKQTGGSSHPPRQPRPPMRPFILTRDTAQAKVFGAGYPSLPTMTVDDWYSQHRRQGVLPDQGVSQKTADLAAEDEKKTEQKEEEEEDNEAALQRARDWDDWKDTHRRGYGNRQNMG